MDSEKLIEAVRLCGSTPKVDQCKQCAYWSGGDMSKCIPRMTTDAATALSTLQAENEKLRAELERLKNCRHECKIECLLEEYNKVVAELERAKETGFDDAMNAAVCSANEVIMEKELRACKAELEQVKRCIEIVEKQRDAAIKELENYMVQDVLDGNEPCKICAKASDIPCEYCNPKWCVQKEDWQWNG